MMDAAIDACLDLIDADAFDPDLTSSTRTTAPARRRRSWPLPASWPLA
jgi:hypothetical protein